MKVTSIAGVVGTLVAAGVMALPVTASAHGDATGVEPSDVDLQLDPGQSTQVVKTVHTSPVPPNPDIVFLADTTGSMDDAIADVQANIGVVMGEVAGEEPTSQFAAAEYEDHNCNVAYQLNQALTTDKDLVQTAVDDWVADAGCDQQEAQLFALRELATHPDEVGFRTGGTRIVAWFGDASGHDPSGGATLANTIDALEGADIRVVAINTPTPFGDGLDATGQATEITNATDGVFLDNVDSGAVADAILAGIQAIPVTVTPELVDCDDSLSVTFDAPAVQVSSGEDAVFTETVSLDADAPQGETLHCTVRFLIDGNAQGPAYTQTITVDVNDVTAPVAECASTVNPAGGTVPSAGTNPKSGQNPDGYYQLNADDNVDDSPAVYLVDTGSGTVFGPFASGTRIKYTENKAQPGQKKAASDSDAVQWHINGNGDAEVFAVDAAGNVSDHVSCIVPPLPK